jgi:hypothetical protein
MRAVGRNRGARLFFDELLEVDETDETQVATMKPSPQVVLGWKPRFQPHRDLFRY